MTSTSRTTLLDGVSADTESSTEALDGAGRLTLVVSTPAALDTAGGDTLTVTLEGTIDGTDWVALSGASIAETDLAQLGGSGRFAAYVTVTDTPLSAVRADLTSYNDAAGSDLTVTAKLLAAEE